MNAFITGTDTGVGKTYVTARFIRDLRARGIDAVGFKPLCCGSREDAEILREASGYSLELNEVNPVWLRAPAAPYAAALIENRSIDLALIREIYARLRARHGTIMVEGVGGWQVPILQDYTTADFARECALPVIVVVANRLGALNHTALTVESIRASGLVCAGVVLNNGIGNDAPDADDQSLARTTNRALLEEWLRVRVICEVAADQAHMSAPLSDSLVL